MNPKHAMNFKDPEQAFGRMGLFTLLGQILLFFGMSNRFFNKLAKKMMKARSSSFLGLSFLLKKKTFKQFCGGESVDGCASTIGRLYKNRVMTILDYSVEGEESEENFAHTTEELIKTIIVSAGNHSIASAVFKVSGIGRMELLEKVSSKKELTADELQEYKKVTDRVERLCSLAHANNVRILIDAEHSWIQPAIDHMAEEMMAKFNRQKVIVFTTIQMYRTAGLNTLQESLKKANANYYFLGVKIVRGAYMEKESDRALQLGYPSPIHSSKEETDNAFNEALEFCVNHLGVINACVGTHNENSCALLVELLNKYNLKLSDERIFIAQLCGMSDHISILMAQAGVQTAKYVPYGPLDKVIPYLLRRVNENKSVEGEASRELNIRAAELKRRLHIKQPIKTTNHDNTARKYFRRPIL